MKDKNYNILEDDNYTKANFQLQHLKRIRYRLMKGREMYNKNNKKFSRKDILAKLDNHDISISEQTFDSLFDPTSNRSSIDITAVVYLCQLLDLDIAQVLAFPEETIVDMEKTSKYNNFVNSHFKILDDWSYNGTFYFYIFKYSGMDSSFHQEYPDSLCKTEDLIQGKLVFDIKESSGSTATLSYEQMIPQLDKSIVPIKKTATCIPMVSTSNDNVYLNFVDNDCKTYQIVFDKQTFYSGGCYFRIAGMFIESSDSKHLPMFQKMLLVRTPLQAKQYCYIKGILNLNQETVIISPKKLSDLAEEDSEIKKFVECYGQKIDAYKKELLIFNKNMILSDNSEMSKESRASVLLKLWHHTFSQNLITIAVNDDDHKIFKKLQQDVAQAELTNGKI